MAGEVAAARLHDPVAHTEALRGFLAGAVVGIAAAAGVAVLVGMAATAVAAEVATGGLATPLVAGAAVTVGEFAVNMVVGGALTQAAENEGEALGSKQMGPKTGEISAGAQNVYINGRQAARALDADTCHASKIAQGSKTVHINGRPAARVGDKLTCGGAITDGSPNVLIGGPTATEASIQSEVPSWVRWAVIVASLLPALGAAARAIGPAIAEVEAGGLGRAMQVGAGKLSPEIDAQAARLGTTPEKLKSIIDTPKADRPAPDTYLSPDRMSEHADAFQNGASRLTLQSSVDKYGLGQRDGTTFVMTPSETDGVIANANGDPRALESALGLPPGQLDDDKLVRVDFTPQSMTDLNMRMPSGSEAGANSQWMPGGYLPSGANEAVIDGASAQPQHYTINPVN